MMEAAEFDEIVAGVTLDCDYTIANGGDSECQQPALWYVDYHSCNAELLCGSHSIEFAAQVVAVMREHGSVVCTGCNESFTELKDFISVRRVG